LFRFHRGSRANFPSHRAHPAAGWEAPLLPLLMSFAIFDLDQTLLPFDTQVLFCNYVLKKHPLRRAYLALFGPAALLKAVHLLSTRTLKRVFSSYLHGLRQGELEKLVSGFVEEAVMPVLYAEVMAEVERHRAAGRILILNSASPHFYVNAIGRRLGFHHSIGTALRLSDPMALLPEIDGPNNKYDAKLKAMRHLMPVDLSLPLPGAWAYSDSKADLPLLRFVENPVTVHPDRFLKNIAEQEHWTILTPPRPNPTRANFLRDCLLQALGCFPVPARPAAA
jgi:HAD superfamily hydrolase (TIGR01490 family)